jgi:monothiol glutaredoxin
MATKMFSNHLISSVSYGLYGAVPKVCCADGILQVFRQAARPAPAFASRFASPRFSSIAVRHLSAETRAAIDKAVGSAPVVLFMKGTPETPQCGFSRASIQILGLQGVDPAKFTAFNVLEDEALRAGKCGDI